MFGLNLHNEFQDQKSLSFSGAKSAYGKIGSGDVARLSFDQRPDGCCSQTTVDRGIFQRPKEMHLPMLTVLEAFHVPMIATGWIGAALALLLSREASGTYCVWSLYVFGLEVLMLALAAGDEDESVPVVPFIAAVAGLRCFALDHRATSQLNPRRPSDA